MMTQNLKKKKLSSQSTFVRETIQSSLLEGIIDIPRNLKNRLVEVILLPIEKEGDNNKVKEAVHFSLKTFAGAWQGETLVREDQGKYENREELL
jgi:hypothetical protein